MAIYMWREKIVDYLCFTSGYENSTLQLRKNWSPTVVSIEISTDLTTWSDYTFWDTISLPNEWDKVYFRNKSETDTGFSTSLSDNYQFIIENWYNMRASGDVTTLLNKNWTTTLSEYCFAYLFQNCHKLFTPPSLLATTLAQYCYYGMFFSCSWMYWIPSLPATTLPDYCYSNMFNGCSNLALSTSQSWTFSTPYRLPTEWTWTALTTEWNYRMFYGSWGSVSRPAINTTYYTNNQVV